MGRNTGVLIIPEGDADYVRAKHWLVARNKAFRTIYIRSDHEQPVILVNLTRTDKLLYYLTFGLKREKLTALC